MSRLRWYVAGRVGWMVVTAWVVLTLAFVLFTVKPDPNIALVRFAAAYGGGAEAERAAVEAYKAAHNYDVPVTERYAKWMLNYATFRWGTTLQGIPIAALVGDSLAETLTYLVPSLIVSTVAAHALGLYMALNRGGLADRFGSAVAYVGYGVPAFFAAEVALGALVHEYGMLWLTLDTARAHEGVLVPPSIDEYLLPGIILTSHLVAIQLVFIRSEVAETLNADFMKTLVASGAGPVDLARHALRNAAIPLLSSFFAQILTIIYLDIIAIEVAIGPSGFGKLTFNAFTNADLGLILGVSLVPIMVGLVGNLGQDLAYTLLDPRVEQTGSAGFGLGRALASLDLPVRTETIAASALVVVVVLGVAAGMLGVGLPGIGDGGAPASPTATPEPGLDVRIGYPDHLDWELEIEVTADGTTETRSITGSGTEVIEVDPDASAVEATVRKVDGSDARMVLQIVKDGRLVDSASTTQPFDRLQVSAEFDP